ncbi:GH1 family beta-glucosidase [Eubacterium sp.]
MGFCKDFAWGVATASYQIEGGAYDDGKGLNVWDVFCKKSGKIVDNSNGDVACDHYNRYKEDVKLMKDMGINAYRFSLNWARIIPAGIGTVNQKGIDYYNSLIDELIRNGIEPYVTLFHWDYPLELENKGGWLNPDSPRWFEYYTGVVAEAFGDRVKYFITFNEPQCIVHAGYSAGAFAPGKQYADKDTVKIAHNILLSHGLAVQMLRKKVNNCKVGYAPCCEPAIPVSDSKEDIEAAKEVLFGEGVFSQFWALSCAWWSDPVILGKYPDVLLKKLEKYLPKDYEKDMSVICQPLDFYGQNIYKGFLYKQGFEKPEQVPFPIGYPHTAIGWPVTPECMYWGAKFLYERYKLPFIITENGISCRDIISLDGKVHDTYRIDYMQKYLMELKKASDEGVDVKGYFVWTFMDNFEWAAGYQERFGLIYTDYQSLERIPKDSYYWYKKVVESNGENLKG